MARRVMPQRTNGSNGARVKQGFAIVENLFSVTSSNIPIVSVPAAFADLRRNGNRLPLTKTRSGAWLDSGIAAKPILISG